MTEPKRKRTKRTAPPGWYRLQDAATRLGVSPGTMSRWVASGFVCVGYPDGPLPLVSGAEVERVLGVMEELEGLM